MAIDDGTRLAFIGVHPDERAATTVHFVRDAATGSSIVVVSVLT